MTTKTENELFEHPTHKHALKDVLLVTLVAAITAGFLAEFWRPAVHEHRVVTPAVAFANR